MSRRSERMADLLQRELAEILAREVQDPRARLTSVSSVRVSPDLKRATLGISVLGDDRARREALAALIRARGFVRRRLAVRLRTLRSIPELVIELDRGAEYSRQIEDLLEAERHGAN